MNNTVSKLLRKYIIACLLLLLNGLLTYGADARQLEVCANGKSRIFLDISKSDAGKYKLGNAINDFKTYFKQMTGSALPQKTSAPLLFHPGQSTSPMRFECEVKNMSDSSNWKFANGEIGLVLSPNGFFSKNSFAEKGEKVSWMCTLQKASKRLIYNLKFANKPFYGSGFGPFRACRLASKIPDFAKGETLKIALEIRGGSDGNIRGGYTVGSQPWVYTKWFDPTKAGTDNSIPKKSDKNGPQAWAKNWQQTWSQGTAFYVTAYGPMKRNTRIEVDSIQVTMDHKTLFKFSPDKIPDWNLSPVQGTVSVDKNGLLFVPEFAGWSVVGFQPALPGQENMGIPVQFELTPFPPKSNKYDSKLVQGFSINVTEKAIKISAHTPLGLQNAVYYLLDKWGCKWIMPGKIGECIPHHETLSLPKGVISFSPFADMTREAGHRIGSSKAWYTRNMSGWRNMMSTGHFWLKILPPKKYFKQHPEWYSLIAGKRQPKQLCTSNPEVIKQVIKLIKQRLRQNQIMMCFPMDPEDHINFCQCTKCTAQDIPGLKDGGAPVVTDRVVRFANAIAEGIKDEFPDRFIGIHAYSTHSTPPVKVKPASNVIVSLTRSAYCLLHLMPDKSCADSNFHSFIKSWRKMTPNIYGYEYDPIPWTAGLFCPTYLEITKSLKYQMEDLGIKGIWSDGSAHLRPEINGGTFINAYMARRIKVDPTQSPEKLLDEMCDVFFGPAAEPMKKFYRDMSDGALKAGHPGTSHILFGTTFFPELFTPAMISNARTQLEQALKLSRGKAPYAERVAMVNLSLQYLTAYLNGIWKANAKDYNGSVAAFDEMDKLIAKMGAKGYINLKDAKRHTPRFRKKALVNNFPEKLGYVTDWYILGPFDNSDANAIASDKSFNLISFDKPVAINGKKMKWREVKSKSGQLNLDMNLKKYIGNWQLSYAYAGTRYYAPKNMTATLMMDSFFPFRLYVNNKRVIYKQAVAIDCPDRITTKVFLKKGWNTIVFKACQNFLVDYQFIWGIYLKIVPDKDEIAVRLPEKWKFKTDPDNSGEKKGWNKVNFNDAAWLDIPVPGCWEHTAVGNYDGYAWYRTEFTIPKAEVGKPLLIKFDGVDESVWVYLNGQYAGERTVKSTGKTITEFWNKPFTIKVTPKAGKNVLAVKVHDSTGLGGIYKPVIIYRSN